MLKMSFSWHLWKGFQKWKPIRQWLCWLIHHAINVERTLWNSQMKDLDKGSQSRTLPWCSRLWGCGLLRTESLVDWQQEFSWRTKTELPSAPGPLTQQKQWCWCVGGKWNRCEPLALSRAVTGQPQFWAYGAGKFWKLFGLLPDLHRGWMP